MDEMVKALQHPVSRSRDRGRFDAAAERASYFASSPLFFGLCALLVLVWAGGYVVGMDHDVEFALGTLMTAVTLMLVALLKNAELRSEHAIQRKLDALATAMLEELRQEHGRADPMLDEAIRLEDEV